MRDWSDEAQPAVTPGEGAAIEASIVAALAELAAAADVLRELDLEDVEPASVFVATWDQEAER